MKNLILKGSKALAPAALNTATKSTNTVCWFLFKQPKTPKALLKLTEKE